jgi:hypothetical protein
MQSYSYASLQSRLVRPGSDHDEYEKGKGRERSAPTKRVFGFQRKLDQLGSVCISRKTKSSRRQRSITLAAILVRQDIHVSFAQLVLDGTAAENAPRFGPPGEDLLRLPRR